MKNRFTRLLLIFAIAAASIGMLLTAPIVLGQEKKPPSSDSSLSPLLIKVFSRDGRESLTATCDPIGRINQVTCRFVHVRFNPPEVSMPLSVEEFLKVDPSSAEEVAKNPKKFEQEWRNTMEKLKQDFCLPSFKERIETKMREPETGPKRKGYYQQVLAACADKDPTVFLRLFDIKRRTCGLWVDHFTLEFKKVREGQWLYQQETPDFRSKALKVYELTSGEGIFWTLTETRVPTEGAEEKPAQTVWSWQRSVNEYELPCDFISHDLVQFQGFLP